MECFSHSIELADYFTLGDFLVHRYISKLSILSITASAAKAGAF